LRPAGVRRYHGPAEGAIEMEEQLPNQETGEEPEESGPSGSGPNIPRIVFAVTSLAFLVYIAFGTIEARIWRFGRLNFEDRTIRHVWSYFGDRLPDLPGQTLITGLYWAGLAVMVIGTVAGLWLFLGTPDEDPAGETHPYTEHPSTHA
jgi:hypothetical protein